MCRLAFLVLLSLAAVIAKDCDCSDERLDQAIKETNDIVEFLNVLAAADAVEDEKYPAVPPAVITGALGCDCTENLRKKRRIFPVENVNAQVVSPKWSKRNCPKGLVRIGSICMSPDTFL